MSQLRSALLIFDVFLFFRVVFQLVIRMQLFQNSSFPVSDLVNFVSLLCILVVFSSFSLIAPSLWFLPERLRKRVLLVDSCSLRLGSVIFTISEPIAHHSLRVSRRLRFRIEKLNINIGDELVGICVEVSLDIHIRISHQRTFPEQAFVEIKYPLLSLLDLH